MTAINAVGNALTGSTGTGAFVGATAPTITTPIIGVINDTNSFPVLNLVTQASAVNYLSIGNASMGLTPEIGSGGADTNINITYRAKAAGSHLFISQNTTVPMIWSSGTSAQHTTQWQISNTAATRTLTIPDADGTIALTSGASGIVNSGTTSQLAYYASSGTTISGLATANSGVLITSSGGVPSISSTLPSGIAATNMSLTTPTLGVASATSINFGQTTLNNYQEGTWTPADNSGASLSFTSVVANYTRIGRMVVATCTLTYPSTVSGANASITGLPFTSANSTGSIGGVISYSTASTLTRGLVIQNSTNFNLYSSSGVQILNSALTLSNNYFIAIYFV